MATNCDEQQGGMFGGSCFELRDCPTPAPKAMLPVLLVRDLGASLRFFRQIGFSVIFTVDSAQCFSQGEVLEDAVFASIACSSNEILLEQSGTTLSDDVLSRGGDSLSPTHLHNIPVCDVLDRVAKAQVVKGPTRSSRGMQELCIKDLDGHLLCFASAAA
jgi:predicted lactoylglutathione lyase